MKKLILLLLTIQALSLNSVSSQDTTADRLDCVLVEDWLDEQSCKNRGCHFDGTHPEDHDMPYCYLDRQSMGYTGSAVTPTPNGFEAKLTLKPSADRSTPEFVQIPELKLTVNYVTENILRIRFTDAQLQRWEVPLERLGIHIPSPGISAQQAKYEVTYNPDFHLVVSRRNGTKLIDSSVGGLIYSDQYIQFATYLASGDVYGFGGHAHKQLKRNLHYETLGMFTRDQVGVGNEKANYYSQHPFFTVAEKDGKAYGIFLLNSNAQSYTMFPAPGVALKTSGGILDLFVFVGDNPEHVIQLYTLIVGRPYIPAFWSLGFQQSRWGYINTAGVAKVINRTLSNGIPLDVQYVDSEYKFKNWDWSWDMANFKELPALINQTKADFNLNWVPIIDPCIAVVPGQNYIGWEKGHKRDIFIKWPANTTHLETIHRVRNLPDARINYGAMWHDAPVAYVDFFKPATREFWSNMFKHLYSELGFRFDGIWLDMNEPSSWNHDRFADICPNDDLNFKRPRWGLYQRLSEQTLCMNSVQGEHDELLHYNVHSLYALSEALPTREALYEITGKRGFILSRSSFPSSGRYVATWMGDNYSDWDELKHSIIWLLEMNMFGINFVGLDICGFFGIPTPELCRRWSQIGAYYTLARNHNNGGQPDHDPGYFAEIGHPEVTQSAKEALRMRYQLLHYLYTRFYKANQNGETIIRPLFHQFPLDPNARSIYEQFLLGPSIMVNPFLNPNQTSVQAYIPANSEWYRLSADFVIKAQPQDGHVEFLDAESSRPLLFQAGSILPVIADAQLPKLVNTVTIRRVPLELWILPSANGTASGDLFYDDGESIDTVPKSAFNYYEFRLDKCTLKIEAKNSGYQPPANSQDVLKVGAVKVALVKPMTSAPQVTIDENVQNNVELKPNELKIVFPELIDLLKVKQQLSITIQATKCFVH